MEAIYKTWCPECSEANFINDGDTSDLTRGDIEGVKCHACGHKWLLDWDNMSDDEREWMFETTDYAEAVENGNIAEGVPKEKL